MFCIKTQSRKDAEKKNFLDSATLRFVILVSLTTDTYSGRTG